MSRGVKKKGQSFLYGALILTAGMAVVKIIGALFKIPLKYTIGEYGMGLFNAAYNFYGPIFSLATVGFPIAIARMVSENSSLGRWKDVRMVKKVSLPIFFAVGAIGMLLMTLTAPVYCNMVMGSVHALWPMLALSPAILFACVGSVFRGYYEGLRDMYPTAVSEIIEALAKLFIGLSAAGAIASYCSAQYSRDGNIFGIIPASADDAVFITLSFAAAGAILGVTCGSVLSLLYLILRHKTSGDGITERMYRDSPAPKKRRETISLLLKITVPIAIGSIATNLAGLIDATFLQKRIGDIMQKSPEVLLSCYSGMIPSVYLKNPASIPTFLYGCYTLALTVYLLVPALTQAFGVSALPSVTEAWTRGNKEEIKERMQSVVRVTSLFCFPAGVGISALAEPITRVLYGNDESTAIISGALFLLGFASLAAALSTPASSMLQAVGRVDLPVKLIFVAMGIKIVVNFFLCGIPQINILGAGIGTLCCYLFLVISQLWCLRRETGVSFSPMIFLKPMVAAMLCGASAFAVYNISEEIVPVGRGGELPSLVLAIAAGAAVYLICLLILRAIDKKDILMLPGGQKIAKMLEKREQI